MIITAKNKMGASISETRSQDLWGQILRRFRFKNDKDSNESNLKYAEKFIQKLSANSITKTDKDAPYTPIIMSEVDYQDVIEFIKKIDLPEDDIGNKALIHQLTGNDERYFNP